MLLNRTNARQNVQEKKGPLSGPLRSKFGEGEKEVVVGIVLFYSGLPFQRGFAVMCVC